MVITKRLQFSTRGHGDMLDITANVQQVVKDTELQAGIVTVFVSGATGAVTTIEYEDGLVRDMDELFDRLVPAEQYYYHNERWGDGNGHSHVRASLLGPSLTVPVENGRLTLGTWQQIVILDFDTRSRQREVVIQIMGE